MSDISRALEERDDLHVDGAIETVGMFGSPGLFFHIVRPEGPAISTGLVLCPSYFEMAQLQAVEMAFARAAARAGFASIYAQPAGAGDSQGGSAQPSFQARVQAASDAYAELKRRVPEVTQPCFFGVRFGGAVAAAAGMAAGNGMAALWDPAFDPASYWRQVRRFSRVASVIGRRSAVGDPEKDLGKNGSVIVLGTPITPQDLDDVLSSGAHLDRWDDRPCLIVSSASGSAEAAAKAIAGPRSDITTVGLGQRDVFHLGLRRAELAIPPTVSWLLETSAR